MNAWAVALLLATATPAAGQEPGDDDDSADEGGDDDDSADADPAGDEPAPTGSPGTERTVDEGVDVVGEREAAAPFQRRLDRLALQNLPARTTGQLLRAVPGLQLSMHGGQGKALQYLTRGFDAEHGTDIAVSLEGVPLNEVSNIHGQGYLDLHFVPALLVDRLDVSKGPHRADRGDFSTAASADFGLGVGDPGATFRALGGTDGSLEVAAAARPVGAEAGTFVAVDAGFGAGVGQGRDFRYVRGGGGLQGALAEGLDGRVWLLGYAAGFASPGVVRADDVAAEAIPFWGAYPGDRGGESRRVLGAGELRWTQGPWTGSAMAWGGARDLELRSDFTGWLGDPVHGDARRQQHQAASAGGDARVQWVHRWLGDTTLVRGGSQVRVDRVEQSDDGVDREGEVHAPGLAATGLQSDGAAWVEGDLGVRQILRVRAGVRLDVFAFRSVVERAVDGGEAKGRPARSWAVVPSPHARVAVTPIPALEFSASWGRGLRSPQLRGVVDGQPAPVIRSDTVEGGVHVRVPSRLDLRAVFFATWLGDELVFDHVSNRFSGSGSTRRLGVEATASVRPVGPLRIDVELAWADGRFVGSGEPIPFAPRWMVVGAVALEPVGLGPAGPRQPKLSAGLRGQLLFARPLPLGFASQPTFVLDANARLDLGRIRVLLAVDNALGLRWRDGEFAYASCFDPPNCSQIPEIHITAGTPWTLRAGVEFALGPTRRKS